MRVEFLEYSRRTFDITAVEITEQNIYDVAEVLMTGVKHTSGRRQYIEVTVMVDKRQVLQKAFVGDYITYNQKDYKVYPRKSFASAFIPKPQPKAKEDAYRINPNTRQLLSHRDWF